jgi:hypothetical protein
VAALVWLLWAANAVNDIVQDGWLSPFTQVVGAGMLVGQVLVWLRIVPDPMPRSWALATLGVIAVWIVAVAVYLFTAAVRLG